MAITSEILGAYLKCPTKCWLLAKGVPQSGNEYAEWLTLASEEYRTKVLANLKRDCPSPTTLMKRNEHDKSKENTPGLRNGEFPLEVEVQVKIKLASSESDDDVHNESLKTCLHWVGGISSKSNGQLARLAPNRFISTNKPSRDELQLLTFDAYILSKLTGNEVETARMIYGDSQKIKNINPKEHYTQLRKNLKQIVKIRKQESQPDIRLNRHCPECCYRQRCRESAIRSDCLSLIPNLTLAARNQLHKRGIFTITQYSYTFRPRRTAKNLDKSKAKFQSALKALAIRERKIHVVGNPNIAIQGTSVYFDVEGIPDSDFYYLIGVRIRKSNTVYTHSFWANSIANERDIWMDFCKTLSELEDPTLIHYGSFETVFINRMSQRYSDVGNKYPALEGIFHRSINLLTLIYGSIYFPTYSNGLKEVAASIGFGWSDSDIDGLTSIAKRRKWEHSNTDALRSALIKYNLEDCAALSTVAEHLIDLLLQPRGHSGIVQAEEVKGFRGVFKKNVFAISGMEEINNAAYWDYQREHVLVKSKNRISPKIKIDSRIATPYKANCHINLQAPLKCIKCGATKLYPHQQGKKQTLDLKFGPSGVKRWVTNYSFYYYRCPACRAVFRNPDDESIGLKYGASLKAFCIYQIIELRISQGRVSSFLNKIFSIDLHRAQLSKMKTDAAAAYKATYEALKLFIVNGDLIHADETQVNIGGRTGYVWVFTNLSQVIYIYSPSREGEMVKLLLKEFRGVLVTDFYSAYDSLECKKQKCLIHLIRDLNEILYKEPFNAEFKELASKFTLLLRPIIETIDRFGLKKRHLFKHKRNVLSFFQWLTRQSFSDDSAVKFKQRFLRNRESLFTFLEYDNVPWNNNNAEHAVKAFALLRNVFDGLSTEKGIADYLVLLSICETCRFQGGDFLRFLLSERKDLGQLGCEDSSKKKLKSGHPTLQVE